MFEPGISGNPNGRPKGSRNKIKYEVADIMQRINCNPFEILADLAMHGRSEKVRCEAASELASYLAPKLKAVEISSDPTNPINVNLNLANGYKLSSNTHSG